MLRRKTASGDLVSGYQELTEIGSGGSAIVYRAYQERFDRTVALKVLDGRLSRKARDRFDRECALMGRLSSHPGIATVLDSGVTSDGRPFLAMEYLPEGSMADRVAAVGPLSVSDALGVGVKLAGALAAAHDLDVVHRDVKPENVLISAYGEPMLSDFGIAVVSEGADTTATTTAMTPVHAPPEVLEQKSASAAGDVYSLGSTLYYLLAGRPAFEPDPEEGPLPFFLRVVRDDPPRIVRRKMPDSLWHAVVWAMSKDPDDRPSPEEFAEALRGVQRELGVEVSPLRTGVVAASPVESADVSALEALAASMDTSGGEGFTGDGTVIHDRPELRSAQSLPTAPEKRSRTKVVVLSAVGVTVVLVLLLLLVGMFVDPDEDDGDSVVLSDESALETEESDTDASEGDRSPSDALVEPVVESVVVAGDDRLEVAWSWDGDPEESGIVRLVDAAGEPVRDVAGEFVVANVVLGDQAHLVEEAVEFSGVCVQVGLVYTDEDDEHAVLLSAISEMACL